MIHIPILRHGTPYTSLDVIRIPHHRTRETFAEMSQVNPGIIRRELRDEVQAVEQALSTGLPAGRAQVARLASRDTGTLDATQVRETAIETLAENLNDSVIAPLFWFAVAGLPGAMASGALIEDDGCHVFAESQRPLRSRNINFRRRFFFRTSCHPTQSRENPDQAPHLGNGL